MQSDESIFIRNVTRRGSAILSLHCSKLDAMLLIMLVLRRMSPSAGEREHENVHPEGDLASLLAGHGFLTEIKYTATAAFSPRVAEIQKDFPGV